MTITLPVPELNLGTRLRLTRMSRQFSARRLSEATGGLVTRNMIANLENGRREDISTRELVALCIALDVDARTLVPDLPIGSREEERPHD